MTSKTGRIRGVILSTIRTIAAKRKRFTIYDLVPPLTLEQAKNNCMRLVKQGEISRVKRAIRVLFHDKNRENYPAIYTRANLRPAHLTNKQL